MTPTRTQDAMRQTRLYYKEDGTFVEDKYFSSTLKCVYFQTWGNNDLKKNNWIYKDDRGELTHILRGNLPGAIQMALLLTEDL